MRMLVTGSAGFIGFHLSNRFLEAGHQVLGYDGVTDYYDVSLKRSRIDRLSRHSEFTFEEGMLEDARLLKQTVSRFEPEIVVHLAAQAGVRYSLEHPESYITSNVVGTANLLEALRHSVPRHFMFASTSSVYGANEDMPFSETQRTDYQLSLYAATKSAGERMCHSYSHLFGIPTTAFRFFTVYGPWGRPDMALFKFVRAGLAGEAIDVYGNGDMRRDFTFVSDLVEGIEKLTPCVPQVGKSVGTFDSLSPAAPYRTVNIAGGSTVELLSYVSAIEAAIGMEIKKNLLPMQPGDVRATHASPRLLEALTGFRPSTPVEDGVGQFVDWFRSHYRV